MDSKQHIAITEEFSAHNYAPLEVVLARGKGAWVWDVEGKKYLDLLTGYSALSFGHSNERLMKVAHEQLEKLTLSSRAFFNDQLGLFCKELAELCGMDKVLPMTSGAEAVETAVKAVRKWGYEVKGVPENKAQIITLSGNFHGRTTTIIGFSDSNSSRQGFGPFTPGFELATFGDIASLKQKIKPETVAVLIEPIQGEGGVLIPPEGYLRAVRALCTEHNVLMIADEIQTGLCRTGKIFACEHEQVRPDGYIIGKAIAGGITPLSAFVSTNRVMQVFTPGIHGSTFGGNPFACRVAREVLALIREERPHLRAAEEGKYLCEKLEALHSPKVAAVRGRGLFIGIDIKPEYGPAKNVCHDLLDQGLLCKDTRVQTIRIAPSLFIERQEIDWALERIAKVLK